MSKKIIMGIETFSNDPEIIQNFLEQHLEIEFGKEFGPESTSMSTHNNNTIYVL